MAPRRRTRKQPQKRPIYAHNPTTTTSPVLGAPLMSTGDASHQQQQQQKQSAWHWHALIDFFEAKFGPLLIGSSPRAILSPSLPTSPTPATSSDGVINRHEEMENKPPGHQPRDHSPSDVAGIGWTSSDKLQSENVLIPMPRVTRSHRTYGGKHHQQQQQMQQQHQGETEKHTDTQKEKEEDEMGVFSPAVSAEPASSTKHVM